MSRITLLRARTLLAEASKKPMDPLTSDDRAGAWTRISSCLDEAQRHIDKGAYTAARTSLSLVVAVAFACRQINFDELIDLLILIHDEDPRRQDDGGSEH